MNLSTIRDALDEVDERLVPLLATRAVLVEAAAREKEAAGLPVRDRLREVTLLSRAPAGLTREMYAGILWASRHWQTREREDSFSELINSGEATPPPPAIRSVALIFVLAILGFLFWLVCQ